MANTKSAAKAHRQTLGRSAVNQSRVTRVRSSLKNVIAAIEKGDKEAAADALRAAEPELARGVRHNVMHRRTMSRRISRLAQRIKAM